MTERVGDWFCLNCNNLNFSFRDVCNRCDLFRVDVGKTIMSHQELINLQSADASYICELAMKSAKMAQFA